MDERTKRRMEGRKGGWMDEKMKGRNEERLEGRQDEWKDEMKEG